MFIIQYWHTGAVPPDVQSLIKTYQRPTDKTAGA